MQHPQEHRIGLLCKFDVMMPFLLLPYCVVTSTTLLKRMPVSSILHQSKHKHAVCHKSSCCFTRYWAKKRNHTSCVELLERYGATDVAEAV